MNRTMTYDEYLAAQQRMREEFCRERGLDMFWMDSWTPRDRSDFTTAYRALAREYGVGAAAKVGVME